MKTAAIIFALLLTVKCASTTKKSPKPSGSSGCVPSTWAGQTSCPPAK